MKWFPLCTDQTGLRWFIKIIETNEFATGTNTIVWNTYLTPTLKIQEFVDYRTGFTLYGDFRYVCCVITWIKYINVWMPYLLFRVPILFSAITHSSDHVKIKKKSLHHYWEQYRHTYERLHSRGDKISEDISWTTTNYSYGLVSVTLPRIIATGSHQI